MYAANYTFLIVQVKKDINCCTEKVIIIELKTVQDDVCNSSCACSSSTMK